MKPVGPPRSDIINPCRRHPSAVEETNKSLSQTETVGLLGCFFPGYSPLSSQTKAMDLDIRETEYSNKSDEGDIKRPLNTSPKLQTIRITGKC